MNWYLSRMQIIFTSIQYHMQLCLEFEVASVINEHNTQPHIPFNAYINVLTEYRE